MGEEVGERRNTQIVIFQLTRNFAGKPKNHIAFKRYGCIFIRRGIFFNLLEAKLPQVDGVT